RARKPSDPTPNNRDAPPSQRSIENWGRACALFIGDFGLCLCFDSNFHIRTQLETYFLTVFIGQSVVDAYLSVKMIGPNYVYLRFVRFIRKWGLDNCFHR